MAAQPIDLKNPDSNHKNAGFSDQERAKFQQFLQHGFVDSFRSLYPDKEGAYTWWSYMFKARERNAGWRIDYFLGERKRKGTHPGRGHPITKCSAATTARWSWIGRNKTRCQKVRALADARFETSA